MNFLQDEDSRRSDGDWGASIELPLRVAAFLEFYLVIDNNLNSCNCSKGGMGHGAPVDVNMYIYIIIILILKYFTNLNFNILHYLTQKYV